MAKDRQAPIGMDGVTMTAWQIWLRLLCIVMIIWASFEFLLGISFFIAPQLLDLNSIIGDMELFYLGTQEVFTMLGFSSLMSAFLDIVIAFLGIRGAKNPRKVTLFFWIALVDAVLTAWALAGNISVGVVDPASLVSGLFIIALATCAWQVRKQTGYFDKHP